MNKTEKTLRNHQRNLGGLLQATSQAMCSHIGTVTELEDSSSTGKVLCDDCSKVIECEHEWEIVDHRHLCVWCGVEGDLEPDYYEEDEDED